MFKDIYAFLKKLSRNRTAFFGLIIFITIIIIALFADVLAPYDPEKIFVRLISPSKKYLLGTDRIGRDVLSRIIYGARASILVAIFTCSTSIAIGVPIGLFSGYIGGMVDEIFMRFMDVWMSFIPLFLAVAVVVFIGPGLINTSLAIAIIAIPRFARIVRSGVLSIKEEPYIEAAKAVGASTLRIVLIHLLPNMTTPIIIQSVLIGGGAILTESAMSFLGLGVQPPTPSWGSMLASGRPAMINAPWLVIFPGIAISLTVLSLNLLGDGLRDILSRRQVSR